MIRPEFATHKLNETGFTRAAVIANEFDNLSRTIEIVVTDARCLAIVKTKLEEACFFAKKGVALDPLNQE